MINEENALEDSDGYLSSKSEVIHAKDLLKNWKTMLEPFMLKKPVTKRTKWQIQQYKILKYTSGGVVLASQTYQQILIPFKILQRGLDVVSFESVNEDVTLKATKVADLQSLQEFLSQEGKLWFNEYVFSNL